MRKIAAMLSAGVLGAVVGLNCNSDVLGGGGDNPNEDLGGNGSDMKGRIDSDAACASVRAAATLQKSPVDVIFVIDNSGSMTAEIVEVEKRINDSFATIIKNSGVDYKIIVVSSHGDSANQMICVKSPLSSTTCSPIPAQPGNTATFFQHSLQIRSKDSYQKIIASYPNWSAQLRNGAYKTFVEITDDDNENNFPDGMAASADNFDTKLLALSATHFGTAAKRNYTFHAIVGVVADPTDRLKPYPATAPLVNTKCTSAVNIGTQHQNMAIKTGGLRYPICNTDDYSPVFKAVADSVIKGAKVACDFALPPPPPMQTFKLDTAQLEFTPSGGGAPRIFNQVADQASCKPDSFYFLNNRVQLCGTTCTDVQADSGAKIEFLLECNVIIG
ncbi:MAG TPA: hypothetical protein PKI03_02515 [Pseudomonadota bacterium]|nr:hypothetical protein [Pseudomonadota bacterium]